MIGTYGLAVTRSAARMAIDRFVEIGRSNHSTFGGTVWVIALFCAHNKINWVWSVSPGFGSQIVMTRPS